MALDSEKIKHIMGSGRQKANLISVSSIQGPKWVAVMKLGDKARMGMEDLELLIDGSVLVQMRTNDWIVHIVEFLALYQALRR